MDNEEHAEFDAWAAKLYSRNPTLFDCVGALVFCTLIFGAFLFSPLVWLVLHIRKDLIQH